MSIASLRSSINQINKKIIKLENDLASQMKKESDINKRINILKTSIKRTKSLSIQSNKLNQIQKCESKLELIIKKKSDITKKLSQQKVKLNDYNQKFRKEQEKEYKKSQKEQERIQKTYETKIDELKAQISDNISEDILKQNSNKFIDSETEIKYDVFISHASEDKEDLVRELAETLIDKHNIKVWYDEFSIKWGDSLRKSIDKGLQSSKFGIVIISKDFIKKGWTNYELDGLFQKEMTYGKTILPIWHKITKNEVQEFSPSLAGKKALSTSMFTVEEIAQELNNVLDD
ncbi:TIR domain-containing protein [Senegalia massiliensis]|uniref:TIR domain-containing protein n=1 Tax=Senegalia massiliensis TaxID=1720316 RepID=A0A845QTE9_9CLOT|nr:TIR domain-containing protein [Senegalia massiliensis]NBI06107.1 TIR domain-containing protein [Senegalia massiliensis]